MAELGCIRMPEKAPVHPRGASAMRRLANKPLALSAVLALCGALLAQALAAAGLRATLLLAGAYRPSLSRADGRLSPDDLQPALALGELLQRAWLGEGAFSPERAAGVVVKGAWWPRDSADTLAAIYT